MSVFDDEQMEFADRYERMADGELLALAAQPWAISDAAWEALEGELERRRIKVPEPESAPQIVVPDKRNLVLLRRFRDLPEALLAKGKLDSAGVDCFLADENMVRMDWLISNLLGGVKLMVDGDRFAEASKLLKEVATAEFEDE